EAGDDDPRRASPLWLLLQYRGLLLRTLGFVLSRLNVKAMHEELRVFSARVLAIAAMRLPTFAADVMSAVCNARAAPSQAAGAEAAAAAMASASADETAAASAASAARRLLQQGPAPAAVLGVQQPVLCVRQGGGVLFDLTGGAARFPVYLKDSLLNTNPAFDFGEFRR
ncbi:MAG: hypothetical protein ACK4UX_13440, partial [Thiobacillus sp.]